MAMEDMTGDLFVLSTSCKSIVDCFYLLHNAAVAEEEEEEEEEEKEEDV